MALRIITTGGTFDKHYNPINGALGFQDSHLNDITSRMRLVDPVATQTLMLIDSLEMHDSHRDQILQACQSSSENQIVIIHGTDTMAETGRVLGAAKIDKTIVLTGAMVPYEVTGSDALFNLGFALGVAAQTASGVYIAMNARVHPWQTVRKNRALGVFES
jgi:L-asparaginase